MMNGISRSLMMITMMIFLILFFPTYQSLRPTILLGSLINKTCKKTPFYKLCVTSLRENPRSEEADVKGLARIIAETLNSKAVATLDRVDELLEYGLELDPAMYAALNSCADRYNAIIQADVPKILEALQNGDYKFAEEGAYDGAVEAKACERGFADSKSPITDMNKVVHDVSIVALSIAKLVEEEG